MAITHHEDTAHHIQPNEDGSDVYRWRYFVGTIIFDGTLQEAADAMHLDPSEIAWAIEEYGRCDAQFADANKTEIVCWKPGEPEGEWGEQISGGYEWPASEAKCNGEE
jgi:hypothetical protein